LGFTPQAANEAMNIAKNVEIANLGAIECKDRHPSPPYVTAAWGYAKYLLTMKPMETHLPANAVAFLDQREDVGGVLAEDPRYPTT